MRSALRSAKIAAFVVWSLLNTAALAGPADHAARAAGSVIAAMNFIGVPYQRGGNGGGIGFDCSGFTRYIFQLSLGLVLPRRVDDQARAEGLVSIDKAELHPGDLVFFDTLGRSFSHVGIYVGEGRFIHAPRSGSEVRIENMRSTYWSGRYNGARRAALPAHGQRAEPPARPPIREREHGG